MPYGPTLRLRRAFTLVEMLIVLVILAILIAIIVPGLAALRNASRAQDTASLLSGLTQAANQFKMSQNRLPGYFSPKDMGSTANVDPNGGMALTALENVLLDLAGGVTTSPTDNGNGNPCSNQGPKIAAIGPRPAGRINVDFARIGAMSGGASGEVVSGYYKPDPKYFVRQCMTGQRLDTTDMLPSTAMPVLVDAWRSPILAWVQDDLPIPGSAIAAESSDTTPALFYRNANRGFLEAQSLGILAHDQRRESLLGDPNTGAASLTSILSSPADPSRARGSMLFHSAGANAVFIGKNERGGKAFASGGATALPYVAGHDYFEKGDFDDVVVKAE